MVHYYKIFEGSTDGTAYVKLEGLLLGACFGAVYGFEVGNS